MSKVRTNILITGAKGFIGSYLFQRLSEDNRVIGVTRNYHRPDCTTMDKSLNFSMHEADLSRGLSITDDVDIIVHTAGRSMGPGVSLNDYIDNNIIATKHLIDFAIKKRVRILIYLSAVSVFGQINSITVDENTPILNPEPYGMSKYFGELLIQEVEDLLPSVIFRMPVVVDKGMRNGWLYKAYKAIQNGKTLTIFNPDSPYNMIHVSDVYDLVRSCININMSGSNLFTVSCDDLLSIRQIVDAMIKTTQSISSINVKDTSDIGFIISMEKVKKLLGFKPKSAQEILNSFLEH